MPARPRRSSRAATRHASATARAAVGPPHWSATTPTVSRSRARRSIVRAKLWPCAEKTHAVRMMTCCAERCRDGRLALGLRPAVDAERRDRVVGRVDGALGAVEDVVRRDVDERDAGLRRTRRATFAAPSRLTAAAVSGSASARSTAVYAAAFTTASGRASATARATAPASVMSSDWTSVPTAATPRAWQRASSSRPTWPSAPVTKSVMQSEIVSEEARRSTAATRRRRPRRPTSRRAG